MKPTMKPTWYSLFILFYALTFCGENRSFANSGQCATIIEKFSIESERSHIRVAAFLLEKADGIIRKQSPEHYQVWWNHLGPMSKILRTAGENVDQHGRRRLKNPKLDFLRIWPALATVSASLNNDDIVFKVINKQFKPFPPELQREFRSGHLEDVFENVRPDKNFVSYESRHGFKRYGAAHALMIYKVYELPKGSSVSWSADGKYVTFTLKVHLGVPAP